MVQELSESPDFWRFVFCVSFCVIVQGLGGAFAFSVISLRSGKKESEFSVLNNFRILSAYTLTTGVKIWLITEAERSVTTILLPEEY